MDILESFGRGFEKNAIRAGKFFYGGSGSSAGSSLTDDNTTAIWVIIGGLIALSLIVAYQALKGVAFLGTVGIGGLVGGVKEAWRERSNVAKGGIPLHYLEPMFELLVPAKKVAKDSKKQLEKANTPAISLPQTKNQSTDSKTIQRKPSTPSATVTMLNQIHSLPDPENIRNTNDPIFFLKRPLLHLHLHPASEKN